MRKNLNLKLTIELSKSNDFYIGKIKEIPEVLTQGKSIEETKENLVDALNLYIEDLLNF